MARRNRSTQSLAQTFRILGDATRLGLLSSLLAGEKNVSQLCRTLRTTQPTVSRHLSLLKMSGLVQARRDGKEMYYGIVSARRRVIKTVLERSASLAR